MAVALFKHRIAHLPDAEQWRVESAGTWGYEGMGPASGAVMALKNRGLAIKDHRSRIVTADLIRSFDLILTMESGQKEALKVEFPEVANRVFMISEMIGRKYDITDPMRGPLLEFMETVNELDYIFSVGFDKIVQLARSNVVG